MSHFKNTHTFCSPQQVNNHTWMLGQTSTFRGRANQNANKYASFELPFPPYLSIYLIFPSTYHMFPPCLRLCFGVTSIVKPIFTYHCRYYWRLALFVEMGYGLGYRRSGSLTSWRGTAWLKIHGLPRIPRELGRAWTLAPSSLRVIAR